MSVDVKHPLDAASTDLLEVSRHRLEPLSTKMEERDADVMKVRVENIFFHGSNRFKTTSQTPRYSFAQGLYVFGFNRYGFSDLGKLQMFEMSLVFVRDEKTRGGALLRTWMGNRTITLFEYYTFG